tara:strand:- start:351 stop:1403 length:1053 start_codon:yes stop_codon:yes gene_type:complete
MASLVTDQLEKMTISEKINYNAESRNEFDDTIDLYNKDKNLIIDHLLKEYILPENLDIHSKQFKYNKDTFYSLNEISERLLESIKSKNNIFDYLPFNYSFQGITIDQKNFSSCESIKEPKQCNSLVGCNFQRNKCNDIRIFKKSGINLLDNYEYKNTPLKVESYHTGKFNPIKGGIELKLNPWDNAIKELKEEVFIDIGIEIGSKEIILDNISRLKNIITSKSTRKRNNYKRYKKKSYKGKTDKYKMKYRKSTGRPSNIETLEIEENVTFKLQIDDLVFYAKLERLVYMYGKNILLFDIRTNANINDDIKPVILNKFTKSVSYEITGIKNKYLKYKKKYLLLKQYIKNQK